MTLDRSPDLAYGRDWSAIDPSQRDHFKATFEDRLTQKQVDGLAERYPAPGIVAGRNADGALVVQDLSSLAADSRRWVDAIRAADDARLERKLAIRAAYRDGATASALAELTGLSMVRVQQIVAGARK